MENPLRRYNIEIFSMIIVLAFSIIGPLFNPMGRVKIFREYADEILPMSTRDADDFSQQKLVEWANYRTGLRVPLEMLTVAFLGAWSDLRGRQINILLGMTTIVMAVAEYTSLWSYSLNLPLWTTLIFTFVSAAMGTGEVLLISYYSYLTDTIPNKDQLTIRITILYVLMSTMTVIGGIVAGLWSTKLYVIDWMAISVVMLAAAFAFALVFIPQIPPHMLRAARLRRAGDEQAALEVEQQAREHEHSSNLNPLSMLKQRLVLAWASVQTLFRRRPGGKRAILIVVIMMRFVEMIGGFESYSLFGYYAINRRFHWDSSHFGYYQSLSTVISAVGLVSGIVVMKKWLKMRDTAIMIVAQASGLCRIAVMFFAYLPWHLYLVPVAGILSTASGPVSVAFLTRIVEPDEVGKTFTFFALMSNLAILMQQYILQNLYALTLRTMPQLVWYVVFAIMAVGFCLMIIIHFYSVKAGIENKKTTDKPT